MSASPVAVLLAAKAAAASDARLLSWIQYTAAAMLPQRPMTLPVITAAIVNRQASTHRRGSPPDLDTTKCKKRWSTISFTAVRHVNSIAYLHGRHMKGS